MTKTDQVSILGIIGAVTLIVVISAAGGFNGVAAAGVPVFYWCAGLSLLIQWLAFIPAYRNRTEHYFDLVGSITYVSVLLLAVILSGADSRGLLICLLVAIWAVRLGSFLFRRVRQAGADRRFNAIKQDFLRFLMTWTLQGAWVLVTLAVALAAITSQHSESLGWPAMVGALMWIAGFAIEVVADQQKSAFNRDPNREQAFITTGLWAWSRHPNYFGEILLWCGVAVIAIPALAGWQWLTLISPLFVILLLTKISGVAMLEPRADKKWGQDPAYQRYKASTPVLILRPPKA
jgi:steroid 5-alpha reductase family enzyme